MTLNKKVIFAGVIAGLLCMSASAAFTKTKMYTDGQFLDVSRDAWYEPEVKSTFELGLMNGIGEGLFAPEGNVTVAEAITMASRASAAYAGLTIEPADGEWYQMYVNYAEKMGFVKAGQFENFDRPAKRYEVASIFENAMPEGYFTVKNNISDIPDVPDSREYKTELLNLYKAGVVMGSDTYGNFRPEDNITRAEAAAIINRVALPENRLSKTLDKISADDAYTLTAGTFESQKEGIASGWVLDNRGGIPRNSITESYTRHYDIREDSGVALIREFNKTETGLLNVYIDVATGSDDGFYMEFQNESGESVYRVETKDKCWKILGADGSYTEIYKDSYKESRFVFRIELDLDNVRSTTYINDKKCGTHALAVPVEKANILNFRFATTDEAITYFAPSALNITANYEVSENFSNVVDGVPFGWTATAGAKQDGEYSREYFTLESGASAANYFTPVSGNAVAEFNVLLPESGKAQYYVNSGSKIVALFTTDDNSFYVNGNKVYDYVKNLWYRVRLELDNDTNTMLVKINGRKMKTIPFAEKATSIDSISMYNAGNVNVSFDNIKVFRMPVHADYVPVPVEPAGDDNYIIGMNVCSLWSNGGHYGWHCITPYDDPQPVLGYYDECLPETADWEIKYTVEHGIDFQAFCVFFYGSGPINLAGCHMYDGFMNAKYVDMAEFAIIYEAANSDSPKSLEEWKTKYVPYFIENFFKHERYAVVDNRPVMCMFGGGTFAKSIGGNAVMKEAFDYMEEEVKKLGFDGMIYLQCGSSSPAMAEMGFDGCYAYNWGENGYRADINKSSILASAEDGSVYTVPTSSVGFNNMPWAYTRHPMMTKDDYREINTWIKDEYLAKYPKEDWQKNLVMLSTWNEYGEGTYIMPSTDEKGFGYIDVIREVYTEEKADASINTVPTEAQKYRINRRYPQYRRLLRKEGWYGLNTGDETIDVDVSEMELLYSVDFQSMPKADMWNINADCVQDENGVTASGSNSDPILYFGKLSAAVDTKSVYAVRFVAKIPEGRKIQIMYTTSDSNGWSEVKAKTFVSESDEMMEYIFPASSLNEWTGNLTRLRIDPVDAKDVQFTVKTLEFLALPGTSEKLANEELTVIHTINASDIAKDALWNITETARDDVSLSGKGTNNDPIIYIGKLGAEIKASQVQKLKITAKIPNGMEAQIMFTTAADTKWSESKGKRFISTSDDFAEYIIETGTLSGWSGDIKQIRIDPVSKSDVEFSFKSLEFLSRPGEPSKTIYIDGKSFDVDFAPSVNEAGDIFLAFQPVYALDYKLGLYHDWNKDKGILKLYSIDHEIVYTVGSDKYTLDGISKNLGFKLEEIDGLPILPMSKLCAELGYKCEMNNVGELIIETHLKEYYDSLEADKIPGEWHFDAVANTEKWSSAYMSLMTFAGYMSCESLTNSYDINDPAINLSDDTLSLKAEAYSTLEYRIRYSYTTDSEKEQTLTMYFLTDVDKKWSESKTIKIPLTAKSSGDEWMTFTADLSQFEKWTDTIVDLRFDPFNAPGHIDIDYIKFVKNPDYNEGGTSSGADAVYEIPSDIECEDENYGTLIWYNNFEKVNEHQATYAETGLAFTSGGTNANTEIASNIDGEGRCVKISPAGAHGGFEIVFADNLAKPGKYTFIADVYIPEGANSTSWIRFGTLKPDSKTGDPNFWNSKDYITNGEWCEYPQEFEVTEGGDVIVNYSLRKSQAETFYVDNVRVYYKG